MENLLIIRKRNGSIGNMVATKEMAVYCFDVLSNHLAGQKGPIDPPFDHAAE